MSGRDIFILVMLFSGAAVIESTTTTSTRNITTTTEALPTPVAQRKFFYTAQNKYVCTRLFAFFDILD